MKINIIYNEDCLEGTNRLPDESIDLIYIDPPFNSGNDYESYNDKWDGMKSYINWMRLRVEELYRVLKPTGSFYLHCDWHANAHLRIMLDEIFGDKNFRNEVIWHYFLGGKAKKFFARKHDTILFYTKGNAWIFNLQRIKRRLDFKPSLPDKSLQAKVGKDEFGYFSTVIMDDVWDIKGVFNLAKEYQDYPTQKPEALLEKIIKASSNEGDVILDAFCGCGTTLAVAQKLGRNWIGIDISSIAVKLAKTRLEAEKTLWDIKDKGR